MKNKIDFINVGFALQNTDTVARQSGAQKYMLNGSRNAVYKYILDRYNGSATHRAIVDCYANFIYGKGILPKNAKMSPSQYAKIKTVLSDNDLRKICFDFELFGEACIEIISTKGKELSAINHLPRNTVAPKVMNDKGEIESYYYCLDFNYPSKYQITEIPAFKRDRVQAQSIHIIKKYEPTDSDHFYYTKPDYWASLNWAEFEERFSKYSINHIQNGFSAGYLITISRDNVGDTESQDLLLSSLKEKLSGDDNANKLAVCIVNDNSSGVDIKPIPVSDAHAQYNFLTEEARRQLMVGHKVTNPILFGIKDSMGLGNNADELETSWNELAINVIQPKQQIILDNLSEVFAVYDLSQKLVFDSLREFKKGISLQDVTTLLTLTKDGTISLEQAEVLMRSIIGMQEEDVNDLFGKKMIFNEQYELENFISQGESFEQDGFEVAFDEANQEFATVPSANPLANSEQDTEEYKVRYYYYGTVNPETRDFCRKMLSANKVYRKEDIIEMKNKAVNPGWGPNGSDKYDIWLYKGGVNCHHSWKKRVYKKVGNMLEETSKPIPTNNDPLVSLQPINMPNKGAL